MDTFGALADPFRRRMLQRLAAGPTRVVDLAAALPVSRPAVSKHLRVLADAGLVTAEPAGRETRYRLNQEGLAPVDELLATLTQRPPIPSDALDALDLEVRRTVRERRPSRTGNAKTKETA